MRLFSHLVLFLLLIFSAIKGYELYDKMNSLNEKKYDFAEINKINYGLFNINIWKEKIFSVIERKAKDFDLDPGNLDGIKKQLEKYLYSLHKDYIESGKLVELFMNKENQDNKLVGLFMNMFKGNIEDQVKNIDFKSRIPEIADQMMLELEKKMPEIKKGITEQVSNMLMSESTSQLNDQRDIIYSKYEVDNLADANSTITSAVKYDSEQIKTIIWIILALLGLGLLFLLIGYKWLGFKATICWMTLICCAF